MDTPSSAEILLVDDDRGLLDVLGMTLEDAGFTVRTACDGKSGWEAFRARPPDLVVLDLLMPEMDGLALCRLIRASFATPIVMLTSRNEEMDRVLGLEMGADDYVAKPFSTRELVARIRAALRRASAGQRDAGAGVRRLGPLALDRSRREVRFKGQRLTLTATEFELIWTLTDRPGHVCTRDQLIDRVYGEDVVVADRTIDTFVKRLRRKLCEIDASFDAIETVRSVGYRYRE